MNSKERVIRSFNHIEADRVPYFELAIDDEIASKILGKDTILFFQSFKSRSRYFNNYLKEGEIKEDSIFVNILNTVDLYKKLGMDIIPLRFYSGLISVFNFSFMGLSDDFNGLKIIRKEDVWEIKDSDNFWTRFKFEEANNTINVFGDCINEKGIDELKRYIKLARKRIDYNLSVIPIQIKNVFECMKSIIDSNKDKFFIGYGNIPFPTNQTFLPLFLEAMYLEPKIINQYLEFTTEGVLPLIEEQLNAGVDAIICTSDYCYNNGSMFSPDHFKKFLIPQYKKIVNLCHKYNKPFIKHMDGNINDFLELLIDKCEIDGIHAIEEKAGMDIYDLKKRYGKKITLLGNIDCSDLLSNGSKKEVIKKTIELIRTVSPGGGHILSSSNSIHSGVNLNNFITYLETVGEYSNYPILIEKI